MYPSKSSFVCDQWPREISIIRTESEKETFWVHQSSVVYLVQKRGQITESCLLFMPLLLRILAKNLVNLWQKWKFAHQLQRPPWEEPYWISFTLHLHQKQNLCGGQLFLILVYSLARKYKYDTWRQSYTGKNLGIFRASLRVSQIQDFKDYSMQIP